MSTPKRQRLGRRARQRGSLKKKREKNKRTGRGGSHRSGETRRGGELEWRRKSRRRRLGVRVAGERDCHSSRTNKPLDGISFLIGLPLSGWRGRQGRRRGKQPGHFTLTTPTPIRRDNCVPPSVPPSLWICINELQGELERAPDWPAVLTLCLRFSRRGYRLVE